MTTPNPLYRFDLFRWCKPCWMPAKEFRDAMTDEGLREWIAICKRHEEEEKAWAKLPSGSSARLQ